MKEAADLLHIHPDTLSGMARRNEIPCAKPGKCYIFLKEDLIKWVRSRYFKEPEPKSSANTLKVQIKHRLKK